MKRWPTKPLGELVTDLQPGFACRPSESGTVTPQIRPLNLTELGALTLDGTKSVECSSSQTSRYSLLPRDVLFNNTNSPELVGKVAIFGKSGRFVFSNHITRIRVHRDRLLPEFLHRFLFKAWSDGFFHHHCTQWINQAAINVDALAKMTVPVPPLSEQERIAKRLDEADELRKLRAQADRRTADLIPALFHDMFGDPEHTRFSVRPLIELIVEERPITYGILKPGPDVEGGIPYVRVLDIKQSHLHVEQLHKTTKGIANQYRRSMLRPGDILVTIRGTVGRTCIVPDELTGANITQDTARLATIPSIEPVYVVEFLNTPWAQGWMNHHTQGQAVKGINLGDMKKLPVPVPPFALQKEFAARVSEIRTLQAEQAASRRRLDELFQSMLHRAFNREL